MAALIEKFNNLSVKVDNSVHDTEKAKIKVIIKSNPLSKMRKKVDKGYMASEETLYRKYSGYDQKKHRNSVVNFTISDMLLKDEQNSQNIMRQPKIYMGSDRQKYLVPKVGKYTIDRKTGLKIYDMFGSSGNNYLKTVVKDPQSGELYDYFAEEV